MVQQAQLVLKALKVRQEQTEHKALPVPMVQRAHKVLQALLCRLLQARYISAILIQVLLLQLRAE